VWQRMPEGPYAVGMPGLQLARAALAVACAAVWTASRGRVTWRSRAAVDALNLAVLCYMCLVEPTVKAMAMHRAYGDTLLKCCWQLGVLQLVITCGPHLATAGSLPPAAHGAILAVRSCATLLARAAGGRSISLRVLANMRVVTTQPAWDFAHIAVCAACVLHAAYARWRLLLLHEVAVQGDAGSRDKKVA